MTESQGLISGQRLAFCRRFGDRLQQFPGAILKLLVIRQAGADEIEELAILHNDPPHNRLSEAAQPESG